jgi:hypothetical protein
MAKANDFSGAWQSIHWYPTKNDDAEESSTYHMVAHQTGHDIVFQSLPMDDGSYMLIRLSVDGDVATGTWYENTSPKGDFAEVMYSGAGQLIISKDKRSMEGLWAGAGMDHKSGQPRVYTGRWELKKA